MAFFIPSIQFFFGLPRALFCFGIHFSAILGNLRASTDLRRLLYCAESTSRFAYYTYLAKFMLERIQREVGFANPSTDFTALLHSCPSHSPLVLMLICYIYKSIIDTGN
jgi:hypothetical protein